MLSPIELLYDLREWTITDRENRITKNSLKFGVVVSLNKRILLSFMLCYAFPLVGCENYEPNNRDIGAVGGAALGAGLGAIVGNQAGDTGAGIAIGAAAGGLAGGLIGDAQDQAETDSEEQEEMIRRQEKELERQRKEIEDIRRQQGYDDQYRGVMNGRSQRREEAPSPRYNGTAERDLPSYDNEQRPSEIFRGTPADKY